MRPDPKPYSIIMIVITIIILIVRIVITIIIVIVRIVITVKIIRPQSGWPEDQSSQAELALRTIGSGRRPSQREGGL